MTLAPSLLAANFLNLGDDCRRVVDAGCTWLHVDVMDGQFVPEISFGLPIVRALRSLADEVGAVLDVHLMIDDPERQALAYVEAGADLVTVQWEACKHHHRVLQQIRQAGARAGMAVNPATPVSLLEDIAGELDLLLVMSVNPGYGGQEFIPNSLHKVRQASRLLKDSGSSAVISVDGGVDPSNARSLISAGAEVLVAGSAVFRGEIEDNVRAFRDSLKEFA